MLTFGDSQTEQSSIDEKRTKPKKSTYKKRDNQNEFTRETEAQSEIYKGQFEQQNVVGTLEVPFDVENDNKNNNNNNRNDSTKSNNDKMKKNLEINPFLNDAHSFKIMSPKGLNKQIQHINLSSNKNEQKQKISSKQNIFQVQDEEVQQKSSNMVQQQMQHPQKNVQVVYEQFNLGENVVRLLIVQFIMIFELSSTLIVKTQYADDDFDQYFIGGISLLLTLAIITIIIQQIKKLLNSQRRNLILSMLRIITFIVYIELRLVQYVYSIEKSIDNQFKNQISQLIQSNENERTIYLKQYSTDRHELSNQRFLLLQPIYIGSIMIIQIIEFYRYWNFSKRFIKLITILFFIFYCNFRLFNQEISTIIYIVLMSFFVIITSILLKFQQSFIIKFCLQSESKKYLFDKNKNKTFSIQNNQPNVNTNQIVSPKFGGFNTNQPNENKSQYFNNTNSIINKKTLTVNKQNNNNNNQVVQKNDLKVSEAEMAKKLEKQTPMFSPKAYLMQESLQFITPREELDSKREMDIEGAKQEEFMSNFNLNDANGENNNSNLSNNKINKSTNNSSYKKENQNNSINKSQNFNQNQDDEEVNYDDPQFEGNTNTRDQESPSFQKGQFTTQEEFTNQTKYSEQDMHINEPNIKKTLECVGEQDEEEEEDNEDDFNQAHDNINEDEKQDANLFEGDSSDGTKKSGNISRNMTSSYKRDGKTKSKKYEVKDKRNNIISEMQKARKSNPFIYNENLLEFQARLEMQDMILNNLGSGVVVICKQSNEVVYVNRQACQNLDCSVEKVFSTLLSLKNIYTLKDDITNFSEILQQFDNPIQLSQLSTMKGLFMNLDKQKEVMICIQKSNSANVSGFHDATASFSLKEEDNKNKLQQQLPSQNSLSIKNYLDTNNFLEVEVEMLRRSENKYIIFSIRNINWNNPLNVIHTTTLKVQYFIRKMISELSIDMNDIREYFFNMNNATTQKVDYNGCIGKIDCMTEFLQDFATSSLLISGTFIPIKSQMNLLSLIQTVIEKIKARTTLNQYTFSLSYDSVCPVQIFSDHKRLDRVFYNLLLYFIDTNEKANIKIKVSFSTNSGTEKRKIGILISCTKKDDEEKQKDVDGQQSKKRENSSKKKSEGVSFSLTQKKAQITNVYMLENMHYGVLLSSSIIQKLEPADQGIFFQSGQVVSFYFQLSI